MLHNTSAFRWTLLPSLSDCVCGYAGSKVLSNVAVIAFCSGVAEGTMSIGLMVKLTLEATLTHSIRQPDSFSSVHISLKHIYNMSLIC